MIELPLVLIGGVLGSSHCIGMCGGFALSIGAGSSGWSANFRRQLIYSLGRIFTYAFLGAIAGFTGWRVAKYVPTLVNVPATLAVVAGVLLIWQGLKAAGIRLRRTGQPNVSPGGTCLAGTMFASLLTAPGYTGAFVAGLATGLLPCGLVYAMLALATSTRSLTAGMLIMAVFGIGTVPVMVATGLGGSLLSLVWRRNLFRAAAWCIVLTGIASVARGMGFFTLPGVAEATGCPFCQ